jgi:hypothetical protein
MQELHIVPEDMEIDDVFGAGTPSQAKIVRIAYTQRDGYLNHDFRTPRFVTPITVEERDGRRYTIKADPERKERVTRP